MTPRKLFLWLLIISTVMLGTLWWRSTSTFHRIGYMPAGFGTGASVAIYSSTVLVYLMPEGIPTTGLEFDSGPSSGISIFTFRDNDPGPGPFGRFSYAEIPVIEPATFSTSIHQLEFPMWAPWLLFVGCAFILTWLMERSSRRRQEMKLAEEEQPGT